MKNLDLRQLCRAIYHWLQYQNLCGRSELFSEAYLSQPIGEFLLSINFEHFQPEYAYPKAYQAGARRQRSMDFAAFKKSSGGGQKILNHAFEVKFVSGKRDFTQEIYDDLYRLVWFQPNREPEQCQRWLIAAGISKKLLSDQFLKKKVQEKPGRGQKQVEAFKGLLSTDLNNHTRTKQVHGAHGAIRKCWVSAAKALAQDRIPDQITTRLAARWPIRPRTTDLSCMVWEIIRPQPDFTSTYGVDE